MNNNIINYNYFVESQSLHYRRNFRKFALCLYICTCLRWPTHYLHAWLSVIISGNLTMRYARECARSDKICTEAEVHPGQNGQKSQLISLNTLKNYSEVHLWQILFNNYPIIVVDKTGLVHVSIETSDNVDASWIISTG